MVAMYGEHRQPYIEVSVVKVDTPARYVRGAMHVIRYTAYCKQKGRQA